MFHNKMKAVTFSYDDGVTQDRKLVSILNKYGLKCTFNINSGKLGEPGFLVCEDVTVPHVKPRMCEVRDIYQGHEIAVHTISHPNLLELSDEEVIREVEEDRRVLSELAGYEVVGMAYPYGTVDARVADLIRNHTGVKYSRTVNSTGRFDISEDLLFLDPTVFHLHWDELFRLGEEFVALKPDKPQVFYIWGHANELDANDGWARFEDFCRLISGHDDIFYGTNKQILLKMD